MLDAQGTAAAPLVQVSNLKMYFPIYTGLLRRHTGDVKAVDDVSFTIRAGERDVSEVRRVERAAEDADAQRPRRLAHPSQSRAVRKSRVSAASGESGGSCRW